THAAAFRTNGLASFHDPTDPVEHSILGKGGGVFVWILPIERKQIARLKVFDFGTVFGVGRHGFNSPCWSDSGFRLPPGLPLRASKRALSCGCRPSVRPPGRSPRGTCRKPARYRTLQGLG